jgi:translation elongation factor EF-Tu-like GTPase
MKDQNERVISGARKAVESAKKGVEDATKRLSKAQAGSAAALEILRKTKAASPPKGRPKKTPRSP